MSVSVTDTTGTITISDGNSTQAPEKDKVMVRSVGNNVQIYWSETGYVSYPYTDFTAPTGATAAVVAAAVAAFLNSGSDITGSGTLNYIPKWSSSTNLTDSLLFDNGTTVQMGGTGALASAQFAMTSTTQGFLAPRMTTAQQDLISTPATGLMIFNTTLGLFTYYTGSAWASIDTGTNDYTQGGNAYAATGTLGLTDANTLNIITNNITRIGITSGGNFTFTQSAATSGSPTAFTFTPGAHTTLAASTEATDILFALERQPQFATGALTNQRAFRILAPTYRFVGASTLTNAATMAIDNAPVAGTNATITNAYALWVQAGTSKLDGTLSVLGTNNLITSTATATGALALLTLTAAAHTNQTTATEISSVNFNLSATKQWATGAITTQREVLFQAPTYGFVGASTITTAATVAISAAPIAGTNATLTNTYSLWVQAGTTKLDGALSVLGTGSLITSTATATGALTLLTLTSAAHTNQTASTEISSVNFNLSATRQWATGAITTQREVLFQAPTYGFVGASTITTAATLAISGAPIQGTNATLTNTHSLLIQAGAVSTATNSYGLTVNAQTGATNNYTAAFLGGFVGMGTAAPAARLHLVGSGSTSSTFSLRIDSSAVNNIFAVRDDGFAQFIKGAQTITVDSNGTSTLSEVITTNVGFQFESANGLFRFQKSGAADRQLIYVNSNVTRLDLAGNAGGTPQITCDGATGLYVGINSTSPSAKLHIVEGAVATGVPKAFLLTSGANTNMTASTEVIGANWDLSATKQWATGALTTQREFLIQAPTYGFVGASTITNAATLAISGAPIAGTNATITNSAALWIQAGALRFDGDLRFGSATNIDTTAGDVATINAIRGRFRKDTSGSTFTLTNSFITANSIILLEFASDPGITGFNILVVAGAGSATITFTTSGVAAAPTANTDVNFLVIN